MHINNTKSFPSEARVFVTGGTGFLGSHFLTNFVGRRVRKAFALVRGKDSDEQTAKLRKSLKVATESYKSARSPDDIMCDVQIVKGCISEENFGMEDELLFQLKAENLNEFWHFAATLSFEDSNKEEILNLNVEGALKALNVARALGIARFIYISTAYSCGAQEGPIPQSLHDADRRYFNQYERSKCLAERAITEASAQYGIALTILRPSVVIGNSQTNLPAGSDTGLYGMLRELGRLRKIMNKETGGVRLFCNTSAEVNFIPIDELMEDVSIISESGGLKGGGIFHLASDSNPNNSQLIRMIGFELELDNLQPADSGPTDLSPLEELLSRRTVFYGSYLNSHKGFMRLGLPARHMTLEKLRQFVVEGHRNIEKKRDRDKLQPVSISASDGVALHCFTMGENSSSNVLLCNALGMPMECMRPLMEHLAKSHRVISWECRGLPNNAANGASQDVALDRHVLDAIEVLGHFEVSETVLVGWCTGSRLILRFAANAPHLAKGLVLLHAGLLDDSSRTEFGHTMAEMMPLIASNRRYSNLFYEAIFKRKPEEAVDAEQGALSNLTRTALMATDSPQFMHLANRPFRSEENLFCYARAIAAYMSEYPTAAELDVDKPITIITGSLDTTTSPESSRNIARHIKHSQFIELPQRDHFALYNDQELMRIVDDFVAGVASDRRTLSSEHQGVGA